MMIHGKSVVTVITDPIGLLGGMTAWTFLKIMAIPILVYMLLSFMVYKEFKRH